MCGIGRLVHEILQARLAHILRLGGDDQAVALRQKQPPRDRFLICRGILPGQVAGSKAENAGLTGVLLKSPGQQGVEVVDASHVVGIILLLPEAAEVNDEVVYLQRDLRDRAIRAYPARSKLRAQCVGEKALGNVRTGGSLLHSGGEGSHRTVIRVHHHTAGDGICLQQHAQIGDLCKLRLVVQRRVFAHPARFIRLAAHDPIADHHIREAQTDGVKAAQRARGLLHRRCAALHLFQGRGLGQCRRIELRRLSLRKQRACGAQQPCQQ